MYVPSHFAMDDEEVRDLLRHHGAGDLITYSPEVGLIATMLPFVHEPAAGGAGVLHGHLARVNEQWRHQPVGEALVVLRGPDAYVTPTWYASKKEHGRVVPTWNYVAAHVYGRLVVRDDVAYVRELVERLTRQHEEGRAEPWSVADVPARYLEGQLRAIVGVELHITRIEAKAKLSQNRAAADVDGVISGLRGDGDRAMADAIERHRPASG
jgi:transcriptional regulator